MFSVEIHYWLFVTIKILLVDQGPLSSTSEEIADVNKLLQNEIHLKKVVEEEVNNLKTQLAQWKKSEV